MNFDNYLVILYYVQASLWPKLWSALLFQFYIYVQVLRELFRCISCFGVQHFTVLYQAAFLKMATVERTTAPDVD